MASLSTSEKQALAQKHKRVRFGDIAGEGDPDLFSYFLDEDYWDTIIQSDKYFVIGRKGTGKSAIYRFLEHEARSKGYFVSNQDFGNFPFEKLLQLTDDTFGKPNQYQSIWLNIILNSFVAQVAALDEEGENDHWKALKQYHSQFGTTLENAHKEVVTRTDKKTRGLRLGAESLSGGFSRESACETKNVCSPEDNITQVNAKLQEGLLQYLLTASTEARFIVQFDRLDDNYNTYQQKTSYYQLIISLCKVVYMLNQSFRQRRLVSARVIVYLRSDIYGALQKYDAESSRWGDFVYKLNWVVRNQTDWEWCALRRMIDKRIEASGIADKKTFDAIFPPELMERRSEKEDVFKYIVNRTFHRPRDVIKFCKCLQEEVKQSGMGMLDYASIRNAEKAYAHWFMHEELKNELNPVLNEKLDAVYRLLKKIGKGTFLFGEFEKTYREVAGGVMKSADDLLRYLYSVGIVQNYDRSTNSPKASHRNEEDCDPNLPFQLFITVIVGLELR
ncbi:MAG: hypothetical protein LBC83_08580 [Oscillospiraceae bacterium]|jgi:hypothetical protein|nr:hypothetical protein [Oscillospiraceae bacterium]